MAVGDFELCVFWCRKLYVDIGICDLDECEKKYRQCVCDCCRGYGVNCDECTGTPTTSSPSQDK